MLIELRTLARAAIARAALLLLAACAGPPAESPAVSTPATTTEPPKPLTVTATLTLDDARRRGPCLSLPEKWVPTEALIPRSGGASKDLEQALAARKAHLQELRQQSRSNAGMGGDYYQAKGKTAAAARVEQVAFSKASKAVARELGKSGADQVALRLAIQFLRSSAEDEAGNRTVAVDFACVPNHPFAYVRESDPDCEEALRARAAPDALDTFLFDCVARRRITQGTFDVQALVEAAPAEVRSILRGRAALAYVAQKNWNDASRVLREVLRDPEAAHPSRAELAHLAVLVHITRGDDDAALDAIALALPGSVGSGLDQITADLWVRRGARPSGASIGASAFAAYAALFERVRGRERVGQELVRGLSPDSWVTAAALRAFGVASPSPSSPARELMDAGTAGILEGEFRRQVGDGTVAERVLRSTGHACASHRGAEAEAQYTDASTDPTGKCIHAVMERTYPRVPYVLTVQGRVRALLQ